MVRKQKVAAIHAPEPLLFIKSGCPKNASSSRKRDQDDLIIERPCLEILLNSQVVRQIQIINGLEKGNITQALKGRKIGTIIYKE